MSDEYIDKNNASNSVNDTRSSVKRSDHSTENQTASGHENMVEDRNSTSTSQNMCNHERAVENSLSIDTNLIDMARSREDTEDSSCTETALKDNLPSTCMIVEDPVHDPVHGILTNHGDCKLMDGKKATVVDSNSAFNDTVGDANKVEDHQPGMVNRRQSTFDSSGNLMDYVADCKEKKIELCEGRSNRIVDRNEATVKETITTSSHSLANAVVDRNKATVEDKVGPLTHDGDYKLVDRNKATVEDTVTTSNHSSANAVVDRNKATVEDTVGPLTHDGGCKLVDRNKATVEDTVTQSSDHIVEGVVDRNKATVEDTITTLSHPIVNALVDRNKATVEDTGTLPQNGDGKLVDRNKSTVEDTVTTSSDRIVEVVVDRNKITVKQKVGTTSTDHIIDPVNDFAGDSTGHTVAGESRSGMAADIGMVDRKKETVEDSATASTQATSHVNNQGPANTTQHTPTQPSQQTGATSQAFVGDPELEQQLQEQCNIVDTEKRGQKWTVQLHVNTASGQSIINYLPSSRRCFEWNKPVLFGRRVGVDVFINDDHASRDHVELIGQCLPNGQVSFMMRNKSKRINSYSVNGQNINDNNIWMPIATDNQIRIAGLVFTVWIIPAATRMQDFVLEIITPVTPQVQWNPTTSPRPHLSIGERVEDAFRPYQNREGYVKFNKLRYLALKAVGQWKQLGRALGLEEWQITGIDEDNSKIYEKSYQMLLTWVWKDPEQATVSNLRTGLEDITVGRGDLVPEYCTTAENHEDHVSVSACENDGGREGQN